MAAAYLTVNQVYYDDGLRSVKQLLLSLLYFRKSVWQVERLQLPAACSRHRAGEEELEEERPWPSDAGGLLLHVQHREVPGSQLSTVAQHGGRSAKVLHYPPFICMFRFWFASSFFAHFLISRKILSDNLPVTSQYVCISYVFSVQKVPAAARGTSGASVRGRGSRGLDSTTKHLAQHQAESLFLL